MCRKQNGGIIFMMPPYDVHKILVFVAFLFCRCLALLYFSGAEVHKHYCKDDNCYNDEDSEHSLPHILQRENETVKVEIFKNIHLFLLSLTDEVAKCRSKAEDKTARDNRRDLSRNVYAYRVHKKEVLRIFLKSHLMNHTS